MVQFSHKKLVFFQHVCVLLYCFIYWIVKLEEQVHTDLPVTWFAKIVVVAFTLLWVIWACTEFARYLTERAIAHVTHPARLTVAFTSRFLAWSMLPTVKPRKTRGDVFAVGSTPSCLAACACQAVWTAVSVFAGSIGFAANAFTAFACVKAGSLPRVACARICCLVEISVSKALCFWITVSLDVQYKQEQQTNNWRPNPYHCS